MGGGEGGGEAGARGSSPPILNPPALLHRPPAARPGLPARQLAPVSLHAPALAPPLPTHRRLRRVAGLRRKRRRLPPPSFAKRDATPQRRRTPPCRLSRTCARRWWHSRPPRRRPCSTRSADVACVESRSLRLALPALRALTRTPLALGYALWASRGTSFSQLLHPTE